MWKWILSKKFLLLISYNLLIISWFIEFLRNEPHRTKIWLPWTFSKWKPFDASLLITWFWFITIFATLYFGFSAWRGWWGGGWGVFCFIVYYWGRDYYYNAKSPYLLVIFNTSQQEVTLARLCYFELEGIGFWLLGEQRIQRLNRSIEGLETTWRQCKRNRTK